MTAAERINQQTLVPIMHWKKFAEVVGIEEGVLRGLCDRDHIPSICFGKHRFINLAKLNDICQRQGCAADIPLQQCPLANQEG
jgi:hypothetical protein